MTEDIPHIKKVLQFEPIETPPQDEFLEDETEIQNFKENIEIPAPAIRPFVFDSLTVTRSNIQYLYYCCR